MSLDGNGTVESIAVVVDPQPMYNLTVDEAHTFFVGDGDWLVHNTCDLRWSLTNATEDPLSHNSAVLENLRVTDGFSAAFDPASGLYLARRSTLPEDFARLQSTVPNVVHRQGGHIVVRDALEEVGSDLGRVMDRGVFQGFSLQLDGRNMLRIGWDSGILNRRQFGNRALPEIYRPAITEALRKSLPGNFTLLP